MADVVSLKREQEKPEPFKIGSTVSLKGGGVVMTVRKAGKTSVIADWHDEAGNLSTAEFPPQMLRHADPDEEAESGDPAGA